MPPGQPCAAGIWALASPAVGAFPAPRVVVNEDAVLAQAVAYAVGSPKVAQDARFLALHQRIVDDVVWHRAIVDGREFTFPVVASDLPRGCAHLYLGQGLAERAEARRRRRQRGVGAGRNLCGAVPAAPLRRRAPPSQPGRGPPAAEVVVKEDAVQRQLILDEASSLEVTVTVTDSPDGLRVAVDAPAHGDPPPCTPEGGPAPVGATWALWDHEVVELFVLGADDHYTELELGPSVWQVPSIVFSALQG